MKKPAAPPPPVLRSTQPTKHLYQGHQYTPSTSTDIRKRFEALANPEKKPT